MNKSRAIKLKCLDCSGNIPKEVTLCLLVDCPLWPFRFGYSIKDKRFKKRMDSAKKNYPEDYREMSELFSAYLETPSNSLENAHIHTFLTENIEFK